MEAHCIACGMPLKSKEDIGTEIEKGPVCKFCVNADGTAKSCREVFDGGVKFFMDSVPGMDKDLAKRIVRKNMKRLPLWEGKNEECLRGDQATDEEFEAALKKLHTQLAKGNAKV